VIIEGQLAKLRDQVLDPDFFAERFREAEDALAATISRVEQQLRDQREHEAEQKRIREEREELERVRAENERLQREADERRRADEEKAAAERAEAERKEREAREAEERRVAAIRTKIGELSFVAPVANWSSKEIDLLMADRAKEDPRDADNTFDFAEFHGDACDAFDKATSHLNEIRRTVVRREIEAYEESERRAAQERLLAAERERQAAEQKRLDDERAELERQRKAAEAKAERERLASLTLRTAAQAVVDHFAAEIANGRAPKVIADLAAALDNEAKASTVSRGKRSAVA
jgi:vacuolar-type H+-ATPase subunit I/STV1